MHQYLSFLALFTIFQTAVYADAQETNAPAPIHKEAEKPFTSFTGKLAKNKVRLRLLPTLDAPVIRELNKGEMVVVTGESEEFYSVLPQEGSKAYIFRTFVLDNVVEGSHVNVRLEPNVDAPVVAQLNTGDKINGSVSQLNNKWLEIPMPASARFWVCKEYIEKIGDASYMTAFNKRQGDVNYLLNISYLSSQDEMQKAFPDIHLEQILKNYAKIIDQAKDFPDQAARAKELAKTLQETYLQKKIAYLEAKAQMIAIAIPAQNAAPAPQPIKPVISQKMAAWMPIEDTYYQDWLAKHPEQSMDAFYQDEKVQAKSLRGVIEPYTKNINNRPGDFLLINPFTKAVLAYLYSTRVNLSDWVGQEISVKAASRENNHFAYPAYFVIELE